MCQYRQISGTCTIIYESLAQSAGAVEYTAPLQKGKTIHSISPGKVIFWYFLMITDADYADDIAILANTRDQAETLLHSLERAAASIGLHVNAHKTEYMCYNQTGDISTLEGTPLKLVDKFTYLGSSVETTEKDIETRLTKAWTAINRLSTIWKSDLNR